MPCIQNSLDGCGAMPVELLSFEVYQVEKNIMIFWKSTYDPAASRILLERSSDGSQWESISSWHPAGPEFDTGEFKDENLQPGMYYYRLKAEYKDGAVDTYALHAVRLCADDQTLQIWPNPVSRNVTIAVKGSNITDGTLYVVLDLHGNTWLTGKAAGQFEVDMSCLPPGVYFVRIPDLGMMGRVTKG
jgi:hypothetical protein